MVRNQHGLRRLTAVFCLGAIGWAAACGGADVTPPTGLNLGGTVTNSQTHLPVVNATLVTGSYEGAIYTPRVTAHTDAQGKFIIDDVCTANNYLEVSASGYMTIKTGIACAPTRRELDIQLEPVP
jgi:hypothetical protein